MKVIIPLAGRDDRFLKYGDVKPLIDIHGKPLIKHCTDSLPFFKKKREIHFIVLKEQDEQYHLRERLEKIYGGKHEVHVFRQEGLKEGAACSVLQLKHLINTHEPLVIYLADIYFEGPLLESIAKMKECSGLVPCFKSSHQKYSYLKLQDDADLSTKAVAVAEKTVISDHASAGFYYFKQGWDFVWAAEEMIRKNRRVNNMFYICPVYQELVERGDLVKIIPSQFKFGLGSPEEIEEFRKKI